MSEIYNKTLPSKYNDAVKTASRYIDILTYNRIPANGGFDKLEKNVQDNVSDVCENLAKFIFENASMLNSPIKSLSLSNVSMTCEFSSDNFYKSRGVIIPMADYEQLKLTGLCCRLL